jgi:hypothetical protein
MTTKKAEKKTAASEYQLRRYQVREVVKRGDKNFAWRVWAEGDSVLFSDEMIDEPFSLTPEVAAMLGTALLECAKEVSK